MFLNKYSLALFVGILVNIELAQRNYKSNMMAGAFLIKDFPSGIFPCVHVPTTTFLDQRSPTPTGRSLYVNVPLRLRLRTSDSIFLQKDYYLKYGLVGVDVSDRGS